MKAITVEKTVQEITGYEADDGTWFRTEEECKKYEASACYAAEKAARECRTKQTSVECAFDGFCGCYEDEIYVYDIHNAHMLQVVNTYLASLNRSNKLIPPEMIGHKVCVQQYYDDTYTSILGTRIDMELRFSKLMDKLFADQAGDGNAQ